jgi:hypothetical protein
MGIPPDAATRQTINGRIRRVGMDAVVELEYSPSRRRVPTVGTVVGHGETPAWCEEELASNQCALVLDMDEETASVVVGYEPPDGSALPHLYREGRPAIGVWDVTVVDRGVQLAAARSAADLFEEVGRYGGA